MKYTARFGAVFAIETLDIYRNQRDNHILSDRVLSCLRELSRINEGRFKQENRQKIFNQSAANTWVLTAFSNQSPKPFLVMLFCKLQLFLHV